MALVSDNRERRDLRASFDAAAEWRVPLSARLLRVTAVIGGLNVKPLGPKSRSSTRDLEDEHPPLVPA
jgi:hypothetical protein